MKVNNSINSKISESYKKKFENAAKVQEEKIKNVQKALRFLLTERSKNQLKRPTEAFYKE